MRFFGMQEGPFTGTINVGLLNPDNTKFLAGEDIIDPDSDAGDELTPELADYLSHLHHEDCTDMAIRVVAEHVLTHHDGDLVIDYRDGTTFRIQIGKSHADEGSPKLLEPTAAQPPQN
ncbi:hypothetical protein E3G68_005111 [Mycobacteroides abscessus]|uniref:hypothetical protein n=1 Tax=Mycobacteroides abscessus TaxID=36809 RepID=UPI001877F775|nr:hypothetical protein [Mycobacteroides abscessus]